MKQRLLALLLALGLGLSSIPASYAQTQFIIKSADANDFLEQEITQFLSDYQIVRNCLRNRRDQQDRPLTAIIGVCTVIQVFDNNARLGTAWTRGTQLGVIPKGTSKNSRLNTLEYLQLLFTTSGVTISPISLKEISSELRSIGIRLRGEQLDTFATAIEQGIIPMPITQAEAKLLNRTLRSDLTIAEALGYLYQVSVSQHSGTPFITVSPLIQRTGPSIRLESLLKEVVQTIKSESLYSGEFDEKAAMEAAIKALVHSLEEDKYIEYYTEDEYQSFSDGLNGNLEGIGAYIEEKDGQIIIVAPIEGSPAAKAGIKPHDIITHIDGISTEGLSLQQAVNRIRGPEGSEVVLTVNRDGKSLAITIMRAQIDVPNLTVESQNGFEIIKLVQFGASSAEELRLALEDAKTRNPNGIIIDLRNNPGGFLDQVVRMVDFFIPQDENIVYLKDQRTQSPIVAGMDPMISNIPVGILINKGSASASEILAGALQSYGIAKIYGETSFGKGTVQNIITLQDPNEIRSSAFKLTTAEYLVGSPRGGSVTIDGVGVSPDSNPGGQSVLVDDENTPQDEVLDAVINTLR